jgi:hypothetical protein
MPVSFQENTQNMFIFTMGLCNKTLDISLWSWPHVATDNNVHVAGFSLELCCNAQSC